MLPNGFAGQRLVLPLGSAWALAALGPWQRLGLGSAGQRCGMACAGQRWAALLVLAAVSSAGHLSAALGIGATQRWAALGSAGQRWAFGSAAQRPAAALPSSGQRWAAVCRYSRCPAVKKPLISAALKSL